MFKWHAYDDMTNFQCNFSTGEVEIEDQAIFNVTEYRERRDHYAYFASSLPSMSYFISDSMRSQSVNKKGLTFYKMDIILLLRKRFLLSLPK